MISGNFSSKDITQNYLSDTENKFTSVFTEKKEMLKKLK